MDSERIEIEGLVGRWFRPDDGIARKVREAIIGSDSRVYVEGVKSTRCNQDKAWWRLRDGELLPADWQPPEPEPERKAEPEVDPLALLMRELYTGIESADMKATTVGDRNRYAEWAARIRKLLGATALPQIGVKILRRSPNGSYSSAWAGDNVWQRGECLNYAKDAWTEAPSDGPDLTVCDDFPAAKKLIDDCGWTEKYWARCVYVLGDKAFTQTAIPRQTIFARRVMLIEEPVPVGEAQEKSDTSGTTSFDEDGYWPPTRPKPSADKVRELALAFDKVRGVGNSAIGPSVTSEWLANRAFRYFRSRSPLRVCTVSDDELARQLCEALHGYTTWETTSLQPNWRSVVRRAKQLLLSDDAVNVDFVVPDANTIVALTELAKKNLEGLGWRAVDSHNTYHINNYIESVVKAIVHAGCVGLLAENWKGSADVR